MTGELTFFSLGVRDAERGRAFYSQLFGWRMEPGPSGQGCTIDAAGVPGGIHGGDPGASPYVFFAVDDLEAAVVRVGELGGVVEDVHEASAAEDDESSVARFGRFKLCRDDQGSAFGLHQPPR